MSQFASKGEAAKARLEAEDNSASLITRVPGEIWHIGEIFMELIESDSGVATLLKGSVLSLAALAGKRFEDRVNYLIEWIFEDAKDLRGEVASQADRLLLIEKNLKSDRFKDMVTEAAVQAARATSKSKIKRLAKVVVSGSLIFTEVPVDQVLEFERHCVELIDDDILLLNFLSKHLPEAGHFNEAGWVEQVRLRWLNLPHTSGDGYAGISAIRARSSFARLQSRGLVCQLSWGNITAGRGSDPYGVLEEGRTFLKFLREVSSNA